MSSAQPRRFAGTIVATVARILTRIGVVLLALAAAFALHTWLTTRTLLRATAVVSENAATQDATGAVTYTSRLRFRPPSGKTVVVDDPHRSDDADDPDYQTGATVPIVYEAEHPEQALIATVWRLYHAACVAAAVGTLLFDLGIILLLVLKRRRA